MILYLGFDDTDDKDAPMGTGRLVREFIYSLPDEYQAIGVVRHQFPRLDAIPYTSNNSSACAIIEMRDVDGLDVLRNLAVKHLQTCCAPGSDPGLCIAPRDAVDGSLIEFGQTVTGRRVTQQDAVNQAKNIELYGLGGTNDGIIGACAAVGLTKFGWCGRFIEFGALRKLGSSPLVRNLNEAGIQVVSVDRDPLVPQASDRVVNASWLRPSLWAGKPVLQVRGVEPGVWETAHTKRKKQHGAKPDKAVRTPCTAE